MSIYWHPKVFSNNLASSEQIRHEFIKYFYLQPSSPKQNLHSFQSLNNLISYHLTRVNKLDGDYNWKWNEGWAAELYILIEQMMQVIINKMALYRFLTGIALLALAYLTVWLISSTLLDNKNLSKYSKDNCSFVLFNAFI